MSGPLPDDAVVGVVADCTAGPENVPGPVFETVVDTVLDAVEATGRSAVVDSARAVIANDPDVVIAIGEPALLSLVAHVVDVPVLPVGAGRGVRSVLPYRTDVNGAVDRLLSGDWTTVERPILAAQPAGARALLDLMLATAEPARISEYTVRIDDEPIAHFRGDGVVVATPAGSVGYARAAGGPVLAPDRDAVVVVPVGAFATDVDNWVVPNERLGLVVQRDERTVELRADDRTVGTVEPGVPVTVRREDTLAVALVDESRSFWKHSNGRRPQG